MRGFHLRGFWGMAVGEQGVGERIPRDAKEQGARMIRRVTSSENLEF
jgi:hypothetical protein